jgi:solute carrier family 35 protein F5
LIGVSFVSYSDNIDNGVTASGSSFAPLVGDLLAMLGALFYGCYTTFLKLKIGNEDRIDMPLFFGFVGVFNVLLLWPMIPILNYTGLETFEIPMNATLWIVIILNAFVGTFV